MFTGIVTAIGTVREAREANAGRELVVSMPWNDLVAGESIAVDGACLTVTRFGADWFAVHVITTSLERTTFASWTAGRPVNLERALRAGDRLGGHLVQGHVDGVGTVVAVSEKGDARLIDLSVPPEVASVSIALGSIAVDGVSLTINAIPKPGVIQVALIPFTLEHTTLGRLRPGDQVHLEGDTVGKYVQQQSAGLARPSEGWLMHAQIEQAIADLKAGKMVVVVDDEDRENEGDLVCAAELVTPETINFMAVHGRGWICLALTPEDCDRLDLPQMVGQNTESMATAYTVTIDAHRRFGVTTGISAADRAKTIRVAIDPATTPGDLRRPGHIPPLRARPGGVLQRVGHTEASVDLARLAGLRPAGVICEIMNSDGSMARLPQLESFAAEHKLTLVTVASLVAYRLRKEQLVHRVADARLPTDAGEFRVIGYRNDVDTAEHVALVCGEVKGQKDVLVRMHSKCLTGDVFHSQRCDCGEQLHLAMARIAQEGRGVIVYLDQEGRGIGLLNKLRAYELQDGGSDTVQANESLGFKPDLRDFGIGAQILRDLGLSTLRVMTNNPRKLVGLEGYGLEIVERVPLMADATPEKQAYLAAKRDKLGHLLAH